MSSNNTGLKIYHLDKVKIVFFSMFLSLSNIKYITSNISKKFTEKLPRVRMSKQYRIFYYDGDFPGKVGGNYPDTHQYGHRINYSPVQKTLKSR